MLRIFKFMAKLTSKEIVQIDSAILAGLIILSTLQPLSTNSILTKITDIENELKQKEGLLSADMTSINQLNEDLTKTNSTALKEHIQNQIEDIKVEMNQINAEINAINSTNGDLLNVDKQYKAGQAIANLRLTVLGMFVPFVVSLIVEVIASVHPKTNKEEKATTTGIVSMVIGAILLVIGFSYIFSNPLF